MEDNFADVADTSKWDGEDEDDLKDCWEDAEEEESKDDQKKMEEPITIKKHMPQKSLQRKLTEKEEQDQAKQREENMSPGETLSDKLESQQVEEDCTPNTAKDATEISMKIRIDAMHATNKVELIELAEMISMKVQQYKHLEDFAIFIEKLIRNICSTLSSSDLQKIKKTVDNLCVEKQKLDKETSKKGGKGKTKANLRIESDNADIKEYGTYESYDYDDFM